jgi:hypothetical protein
MIFLFPAAVSVVLNYSGQPSVWFATGPDPLIVHFWTPSATQASVRQFDLASAMIPGVIFMRVNCSINRLVCERYKSDLPYSIRLLRPSREDFKGEQIAFDLVHFLESETGISRSVDLTLPSLNESSFRSFLKNHRSSIVAFLNLDHRQSRIVLPQLSQLCFVFARERGIGVAFVNCVGMVPFCQSVHVAAVPTIRIYSGDRMLEFEESRELELREFLEMAVADD